MNEFSLQNNKLKRNLRVVSRDLLLAELSLLFEEHCEQAHLPLGTLLIAGLIHSMCQLTQHTLQDINSPPDRQASHKGTKLEEDVLEETLKNIFFYFTIWEKVIFKEIKNCDTFY